MIRFFFFSSRRRHTTLQGDWSSDVCSSDLPVKNVNVAGTFNEWNTSSHPLTDTDGDGVYTADVILDEGAYRYKFRSEERRGGKEERDKKEEGKNQKESKVSKKTRQRSSHKN